jgi:prepilin-type processing-associated H-X9-DG protein
LLVVISIVGLLMAILLTTLTRVRKVARGTACLSNVRQWGIGLYARAADGSGAILPDHDLPWWWAIRDSVSDVLLCPEAVRPGPYPFVARKPNEAWVSRRWHSGGEVLGSYGVNYWLVERDSLGQGADTWGWWGHPVFEDFARKHWYWSGRARGRPSDVPLVFDCITTGGHPEETNDPPAFHGDFSIVGLGDSTFNRQGNHMKWVCMDRHGGGKISMTFLDGSARHVGAKELWTLRWYRQCDTAGPWTRAGGVSPGDWPGWMRGFRDY